MWLKARRRKDSGRGSRGRGFRARLTRGPGQGGNPPHSAWTCSPPGPRGPGGVESGPGQLVRSLTQGRVWLWCANKAKEAKGPPLCKETVPGPVSRTFSVIPVRLLSLLPQPEVGGGQERVPIPQCRPAPDHSSSGSKATSQPPPQETLLCNAITPALPAHLLWDHLSQSGCGVWCNPHSSVLPPHPWKGPQTCPACIKQGITLLCAGLQRTQCIWSPGVWAPPGRRSAWTCPAPSRPWVLPRW